MALLSFFRGAACAAALATLAGCEFLHPPTYVQGDPNQLLVHAVLTAGSDSASVVVMRVGTGFARVPVAGAQVRVIGPAGQATLPASAELDPCSGDHVPPEQASGATGCYAAAFPGGVQPGAEYRLEVDLPTGERVRGRTTVPAAPVTRSPAERERVEVRDEGWYMGAVSPLTIRWTSENQVGLNAWSGRVWAPSDVELQCNVSLNRPENTAVDFTADSLVVLLNVLGCGPSAPPSSAEPTAKPDSIEVMLGVTAYDSVYMRYVRFGEHGVPVEQAKGGLDGAYGVFGSAATTVRRVTVVPLR